MDNLKIKTYKTVPKEVSKIYDGAEEFINQRIEEICCQENLSLEEITDFVYERLRFVGSF